MAFLSKVRQSFGSTFSFFSDSWSELKKVRWPKRKELISYTLVVLVAVIFVAVYFALVDLGLSELIRLVFD